MWNIHSEKMTSQVATLESSKSKKGERYRLKTCLIYQNRSDKTLGCHYFITVTFNVSNVLGVQDY